MKKYLKLLTVILSIAMLFSLSSCGTSTTTSSKAGATIPADFKPSGTVTEWNWNALMITNMTAIYKDAFPDVTYKTVLVATADYMQKLTTTIASGSDAPDILLGESAFRGALFSLNINENLEGAPYNYNRKELVETVIPMLSNDKGQLVGFDQQFCAAGFAYRRDLTQKYFGVSEPDDVAKVISDWDAFTKAGLDLKTKSNGTINMMAGIGDLMDCIKGQDSAEYIDNAKKTIDITARFTNTFTLATKIRDAGVPLGNLGNGTPAWNASFKDGKTVFYNLPSWAAKTYMAGNNPESKDQGLWGLVKTPGLKASTFGGTAIGVYSGSQNKNSAYTMIHYLDATNAGAGLMHAKMGYIYSFKAFYDAADAPIKTPGFYDNYFKGQNIGLYYYKNIAPNIKAESMGYYSSFVNTAYTAVLPLYLLNPKMTAAEGLTKLIASTRVSAAGTIVK